MILFVCLVCSVVVAIICQYAYYLDYPKSGFIGKKLSEQLVNFKKIVNFKHISFNKRNDKQISDQQ